MKRISTIMIASLFVMGTTAVAQSDPVPGKNGNKYVPYEERTGNESIVYFTRNLSAEGLIEAYEQVSANIKGHTGVKLHTGEQNGPNIIPREWVKALFRKDLSDANIVETNTYYEGDRYTTEQHRRTLKVNGWTFCPVDILDEEDTLTLPVHGGKWFGNYRLQLPGGAYPFQRTYTRWFRRKQQEHRYRLCGRADRKGLDSHHTGTG